MRRKVFRNLTARVNKTRKNTHDDISFLEQQSDGRQTENRTRKVSTDKEREKKEGGAHLLPPHRQPARQNREEDRKEEKRKAKRCEKAETTTETSSRGEDREKKAAKKRKKTEAGERKEKPKEP